MRPRVLKAPIKRSSLIVYEAGIFNCFRQIRWKELVRLMVRIKEHTSKIWTRHLHFETAEGG